MLGKVLKLALELIAATAILSVLTYAGRGAFLLWQKAAALTGWSAADSESIFLVIVTLAASAVMIKALFEVE